MRVSRLAAVILPLTLLGCGSSSTPTAPGSGAAVIELRPGSYALRLTMSRTGVPDCSSGLCVSVTVCSGLGVPPSIGTLTAMVRLERSGNTITIRPEDATATFRFDLTITGTVLDGTVSGQLRSGTLLASVASGGGQAPAVATGTLLAESVAGKIDGQVSIGEAGCSNNGHSWTLTPR
jgi:hypothetical protein